MVFPSKTGGPFTGKRQPYPGDSCKANLKKNTEESLELEPIETDFSGDLGEIETNIWTCLIFLRHFNSV